MNVRSLYRLAVTIDAVLSDIIDNGSNDEKEELEMLLDVRKLTDLFSKELDALIKQKMGVKNGE